MEALSPVFIVIVGFVAGVFLLTSVFVVHCAVARFAPHGAGPALCQAPGKLSVR